MTATAIEADDRLADVTLPAGIFLDACCQAATGLLFEMGGHRFPGVQQDTIRPHKLHHACGCTFGAALSNWGQAGGWFNRSFPEGWACACSGGRSIQLPGGPVVSVDQVIVDGTPLNPAGWLLTDHRRLWRTTDPVTGALYSWPCCQLLEYPLTQPGTWAVTYTHGQQPPSLAVLAARELAIEWALTLASGDTRLPPRVTRVDRDGVQIDISSLSQFLKDGRTGFTFCDAFLEAYNPFRLRRRPTILSPDLPRGARL